MTCNCTFHEKVTLVHMFAPIITNSIGIEPDAFITENSSDKGPGIHAIREFP